MTSPSEEPVVEKKNTLTGLLRAVAFAQQQANDEKEVRVKTIKSLLSAREALLPVFGADGNLVLRLSKTIDAVINSSPCEFDPAALIEEITQLAKTLEAANGASRAPSLSSPSPFPKSNSVFIIHGHDENNWLKLDRMLRTEFNLEPIVILARAGQSLPTIQKFENDASRCGYAIAMFTPDDAVLNEKAGKCSQARPNVIFEAGWFIGRLGKDRVLLLVKDGTQLHSDFAGMNRIEFQDDINHKFLEIKRELEASQVIPS